MSKVNLEARKRIIETALKICNNVVKYNFNSFKDSKFYDSYGFRVECCSKYSEVNESFLEGDKNIVDLVKYFIPDYASSKAQLVFLRRVINQTISDLKDNEMIRKCCSVNHSKLKAEGYIFLRSRV